VATALSDILATTGQFIFISKPSATEPNVIPEVDILNLSAREPL
jgi:hypothetical protein